MGLFIVEYVAPALALFAFWLGVIYTLSAVASHRAYRRWCDEAAEAARSAAARDAAVRAGIERHLKQGTLVVSVARTPKEDGDERPEVYRG